MQTMDDSKHFLSFFSLLFTNLLQGQCRTRRETITAEQSHMAIVQRRSMRLQYGFFHRIASRLFSSRLVSPAQLRIALKEVFLSLVHRQRYSAYWMHFIHRVQTGRLKSVDEVCMIYCVEFDERDSSVSRVRVSKGDDSNERKTLDC